VIGLGLMGTAIAARLLDHGYGVVMWNRSPEKADPLVKLGAAWSENPLAECRRVIVSLYSSAVVAEVIERMAAGLHAGQVIVDTKGRKMIEKDFRVQARLSQHLKDVRLMLDAARAAGHDLPLTQTHARLLQDAEAAGFGELGLWTGAIYAAGMIVILFAPRTDAASLRD